MAEDTNLFKAHILAGIDKYISLVDGDNVSFTFETLECEIQDLHDIPTTSKPQLRRFLRTLVTRDLLARTSNNHFKVQAKLMEYFRQNVEPNHNATIRTFTNQGSPQRETTSQSFYNQMVDEIEDMDEVKREHSVIMLSTPNKRNSSLRKRRRSTDTADVLGDITLSSQNNANTEDVIILNTATVSSPRAMRALKRSRQSYPALSSLHPEEDLEGSRISNANKENQRRKTIHFAPGAAITPQQSGQTIMQFLPLATSIDSRMQRRLRRSNLSTEMNRIESDYASKKKHSQLEYVKLREEAGLVPKLREELSASKQENRKVHELVEEVESLKRELEEVSMSQIELSRREHSRPRYSEALSLIDERANNDNHEYEDDTYFDNTYVGNDSDDDFDYAQNILPMTPSATDPGETNCPQVHNAIPDIVIGPQSPDVEAENVPRTSSGMQTDHYLDPKFMATLEELSVQTAKVTQLETELKTLVEEHKRNMQEKARELDMTNINVQDLQKSVDDKLRQCSSISTALDSANIEREKVSKELEQSAADICELRQALLTAGTSYEGLQNLYRTSILDKDAALAEKQTHIDELSGQLSSIQSIHQLRCNELADIESKSAELATILDKLHDQQEQSDIELREVLASRRNIKADLDRERDICQALKMDLTNAQRKITTLESEQHSIAMTCTDLEQTKVKLENELKMEKEKAGAFLTNIRRKESTIVALESEQKSWKEQLEALRAARIELTDALEEERSRSSGQTQKHEEAVLTINLLQTQQNDLEQYIHDSSLEKLKLQNDLKTSQDSHSAILQQLNMTETLLSFYKNALTMATSENLELTTSNQKLSASNTDLGLNVRGLEERLGQSFLRQQQDTDTIQALQNQISQITSALSESDGVILRLRNEKSEFFLQLLAKDREFEELRRDLLTAISEHEDTLEKLHDVNIALELAEEHLTNQGLEYDAQKASLHSTIEHLKAERSELRKTVDNQAQNEIRIRSGVDAQIAAFQNNMHALFSTQTSSIRPTDKIKIRDSGIGVADE